MTEDDLDRVVELERAIFPEPWSRFCFLAGLRRPRTICLVAEVEEQVKGYLVVWGNGELHIANIAVASEARRQGIGTRLVAACEDFARSSGCRSLCLEVRESNAIARCFYEGLGFVQTCVWQGYYSNGENAVIMERKAIRVAPG